MSSSPPGYDVEGHIVDVENGGKFTGKAQLTLQLDRIILYGKHYDLQTDTYHKETKSRTTNTAEKLVRAAYLAPLSADLPAVAKGLPLAQEQALGWAVEHRQPRRRRKLSYRRKRF